MRMNQMMKLQKHPRQVTQGLWLEMMMMNHQTPRKLNYWLARMLNYLQRSYYLRMLNQTMKEVQLQAHLIQGTPELSQGQRSHQPNHWIARMLNYLKNCYCLRMMNQTMKGRQLRQNHIQGTPELSQGQMNHQHFRMNYLRNCYCSQY
jgi:hypothetical protein